MVKVEREQFERNPSMFLEKLIKEYITTSSANSLEAFDGDRIFDEPLVGFADGDEPLFHDYKSIIGDFHLTPREALEIYLQDKGSGMKCDRLMSA